MLWCPFNRSPYTFKPVIEMRVHQRWMSLFDAAAIISQKNAEKICGEKIKFEAIFRLSN